MTIHLAGIAGSIRENSLNRALLRAAERIADTNGVSFGTIPIDTLPLFNEELEVDGDPPTVVAFKERIDAADALLIATPEYQHSIPGVLKNALDWASRPAGDSVLGGKPVAIMGATSGAFGTARAQEALRAVLTYNACPTVPTPEVLVSGGPDKVGADGEFTDDETLGFVSELVDRLVELTELHRGDSPS